MLISTSILSIKENIQDKIEILNNEDIDYIHLDIMDGKFVKNKTRKFNEIISDISKTTKKVDVHLMVKDVKKYVDKYLLINPDIITFHVEAIDDIDSMIDYIKSHNVKVGLAIKPNTSLEDLSFYLDKIDVVLVMSVEPGMGGQEFILDMEEKIDELRLLKDAYKYNYMIEVDGGINNKTLINTLNADMIVVGSYITNSNDYKKQINILRELIKKYE